MHNPSTHCNYTHSSHSYHPRSQESERFRLSVHYGCWVLMCCEWDGPWLQHHFCLLCRQDLKLWSSVKRVNKFLEATAALFFCWRVTLHERRGIIKKCEKCSKLKVEENMWKSRVVSCKKLGLQGIGGLGAWEAKVLIAIGLRNMKFSLIFQWQQLHSQSSLYLGNLQCKHANRQES